MLVRVVIPLMMDYPVVFPLSVCAFICGIPLHIKESSKLELLMHFAFTSHVNDIFVIKTLTHVILEHSHYHEYFYWYSKGEILLETCFSPIDFRHGSKLQDVKMLSSWTGGKRTVFLKKDTFHSFSLPLNIGAREL